MIPTCSEYLESMKSQLTNRPNVTYRIGDHVEILPEFQDEGDADYTWVVMTDENHGRVDIQPSDHPMVIKPIYTVGVTQIKLASDSDEARC